MARTVFRDAGGGRRRGYARLMVSALCLLLIPTMMAGCDLNNPTSPNTSDDLTGQTPNQQFSFSGTIGVLTISGTLVADDVSTITVSANVKDDGGNPIQNLTTLTFSANLGGFVVGVDATGANIVASSATATTFNGLASVAFQSVGRVTGTATIVASLGSTTGSTRVVLEVAPVTGNISAAFSSTGTGPTTATGPASAAVPLDVPISAIATDLTALAAPVAGATMRFRVLTDSTDEHTTNAPARFIGGVDKAITNTAGVGATVLRVQGPGDVVIVVDLVDPNTGQTVATSNSIILVTTQGPNAPTIALTFSDGSSTTFAGGATPPTVVTEAIIATAKNAAGKVLVGATVRFTIRSDTTGGATLADGTMGPSLVTTSSVGEATTAVTLQSATQTVVLRAELLDSSGAVIAVSGDIIATYD